MWGPPYPNSHIGEGGIWVGTHTLGPTYIGLQIESAPISDRVPHIGEPTPSKSSGPDLDRFPDVFCAFGAIVTRTERRASCLDRIEG